jgi:hypothetical protein
MAATVESLKRPIWIAAGTMVAGVRQFAAPVRYDWNWRPLYSGADILAFGPEYVDYRQAVVDNAQLDNIKRFDRVWMDAEPGAFDPLAKDADFWVFSADKGAGGVGLVRFKRLSPDA